MRISKFLKPALKVVGVLTFVTVLNCALIFVLEPYGSKSQIMWTDFRATEDIDTVFVGTSLTERSMNPTYINEHTDSHCYNMATPGQKLEESESAMKTAIAQRDISTVVVGLEYNCVQGEDVPNPGRAFYRYKNQGDPLAFAEDAVRLLTDDRLYKTADSVNWVFPWVSNHVGRISRCVNNVRMKLDGTSVVAAAEYNEPGWHYVGYGYGNYTNVMKQDKGRARLYSEYVNNAELSERKLATLAEMADYCAARGVDFLVVVPPMPAFNILDYGTKYFEQGEQIRALVEAHGGSYYDLNLARPELFDTTESDYYADYQHMNAKGGDAASQAFVTLSNAHYNGEDTSKLFYSTQEEYEQAHKYITSVMLDAQPGESGVTLNARAIAGGNAQVEYRFLMKKGKGRKWKEIRGWSTESSFAYNPDFHGRVKVKVSARLVGSTKKYDHYRVLSVNV